MAGVGAWLGMPMTLYVFLIASVAAGLYALVLIISFGRLRETWVSLKIIWHRVAAASRYLGAEDRVEAELRRPDRRQRVIPFGVMVMVGIIVTVTCIWLNFSF